MALKYALTPLGSSVAADEDPFVPATPYVQDMLSFVHTSSHSINMSVLSALNGATLAAFSIWWRTSLSIQAGTLLCRNVSGQRQFIIDTTAVGLLGSLSVGFSSGSTMIRGYVPDNVIRQNWLHHIFVIFDAGTVSVYVDGRVQTLQNLSGSWPAALSTSTADTRVGSNNGPAAFTNARMCNIGIWAGTGSPTTAAQAREIWGNGRGPVDYRTLSTASALKYYIKGDTSPATELIVPLTLSGTMPGLASGLSQNIPVYEEGADAIFSNKHMINNGAAPWMTSAGALPGGGNYSASPSMCRTSDGKILWSYSRGVAHVNLHKGILGRSLDEGRSFQTSDGKYWPLDTTHTEALIPGASARTDANSSCRSMTLSRIASIGASGRIFCIFNDTDYATTLATSAVTVASNVATATVPAGHDWVAGDRMYSTGHTVNVGNATTSVGITATGPTSISYPCVAANGAMVDGVGTLSRLSRVRKVWVIYSDDDGATWSSPYLFNGGGTAFTSVGRARVVKRPDGKLIFGYYRCYVDEFAYDACVAISDDDGVTWSYHSTIVGSAHRINGGNFQEPYFDYIGANLYCLIRVDQGQDPRILDNELLLGVIVKATSTDNGDTWPVPEFAFDGQRHPVWIRRASDNIMVVSTSPGRATGGAAGPQPPQLRVSRDRGASWEDPIDIPSTAPDDEASMQGDFLLLNDDTILFLYAQEMTATTTRMWGGIIRDSVLAPADTTIGMGDTLRRLPVL